ncbi:MAG: hypothetical protein K9J13_05620 [Saprospiraceae bacterium]|nr:hypothetical protein [Saprospiraceae bacterium]
MDEKDNKRYIKNLEVHKENTRLNLRYSLDRFDTLIITVSSGGLVFSMGFIKDIISPDIKTNFLLLKLAWVLFGSSIISNLISQVTSYYANKLEIRITRNLIKKERNKPIKDNHIKVEKNQKYANNLTYFLNGTSLVFLVGAIIILIIFMSVNLK